MSDEVKAAAAVPFNPVRINGKTLAEYLGWRNVADGGPFPESRAVIARALAASTGPHEPAVDIDIDYDEAHE